MAWYWMLFIYWLILFVGCYVVTESGQNYFYDELTPRAPLKIGITSFLFAALLTWRNPTTIDLFTSRIGETALLAILAFVTFTLILRFHPQHAAILGPITIILVTAATTLAIESLADSGRSLNRDLPRPAEPIRKSTGGGSNFGAPPKAPPPEPAPAPQP